MRQTAQSVLDRTKNSRPKTFHKLMHQLQNYYHQSRYRCGFWVIRRGRSCPLVGTGIPLLAGTHGASSGVAGTTVSGFSLSAVTVAGKATESADVEAGVNTVGNHGWLSLGVSVCKSGNILAGIDRGRI